MRGKPPVDMVARAAGGITPAHAGKTLPRPAATVSLRDHPRACGENFELEDFSSDYLGSPPRMRGKRVVTS